MANYNSIDDIVATIGNATQLRSDTKNDEGTDTIEGVDWFSYGGTVCSNIYANGNSWIGLGASSEHLKVNRRDAAMWNLWREEGLYLNYYKFLRIRWSGYSRYNYSSSSYLITYDVILFDTGDIMLYMVDIPTSYYTGTFTLGSVSYTKPTTDNRYVTFYLQEDGSYSIDYAPISLQNPYNVRYLIRDGYAVYTEVDGALSQLSIEGPLTASIFEQYGIDTVPTGSLLLGLASPEILCWTDGPELPNYSVTVNGTPEGTHEIISDDIPVGRYSIYGISSVEAVASDGAKFYVSVDDGEWVVYNVDSGTWETSDTGMTDTELVEVPADAWNDFISVATKMRLKAELTGTDTVTNVTFNFDNVAPVSLILESEVE